MRRSPALVAWGGCLSQQCPHVPLQADGSPAAHLVTQVLVTYKLCFWPTKDYGKLHKETGNMIQASLDLLRHREREVLQFHIYDPPKHT